MKEQLLKLQEVFAKAKGTSIELGLTDDAKKVVKKGLLYKKSYLLKRKYGLKQKVNMERSFQKYLIFQTTQKV